MRDFKDLVAVAQAAAGCAAEYLRSATPPPAAEWTVKARHDFATQVDRAAESLIAEALLTAVPGSTIVGEELSPEPGTTSDVVWIVDPLDGTTNFLHGYPQYAVSIGATVGGRLAAGVVHDVPRNVVYHGAAGFGAWAGDRRLTTSRQSDPDRALVATGFPFRRPDEIPTYLRQLGAVLRGTSGVRRAGAATLDLADVASGRLDAFWEQSLAPWDVAAGVLLVREAGGIATTIDGDENILGHGSILAGTPALHAWLRELLRTS